MLLVSTQTLNAATFVGPFFKRCQHYGVYAITYLRMEVKSKDGGEMAVKGMVYNDSKWFLGGGAIKYVFDGEENGLGLKYPGNVV